MIVNNKIFFYYETTMYLEGMVMLELEKATQSPQSLLKKLSCDPHELFDVLKKLYIEGFIGIDVERDRIGLVHRREKE